MDNVIDTIFIRKEVINISRILVNVDYDGVVIPNKLEEVYRKTTINKYIKITLKTEMMINKELLRFFARNQDRYTFRLWTNRNSDLYKVTINSLGNFKVVFDSFHFYAGEKGRSRVEGIVIDNDNKYLHCGELGGILYQFKGNKEM